VDLLDAMARRNPGLPRAAARLHRDRLIPPDTYVLDLDAVRANAQKLRVAFDRHRLVAYYEPKQFGRCPLVCAALVDAGFEQAIALDLEEARSLHANRFRVGHVGHLGQPSDAEAAWVVDELRPEVVTVFSKEKAARLPGQDLLLRPIGPEDLLRDLVTGGTPEDELVATAHAVGRVVGVTSYPVLRYDVRERGWAPTANMATLARARENLEKAGFEITQVNAAGNACVSSAELLAVHGATHVEPGHAFVGSTPGHFFEDFDELPALAWVSEVSHALGDRVYAFAHGLVANHTIGFWNALDYERLLALVGSDPDALVRTTADPPDFVRSDPSSYLYLRIHSSKPRVGDTVVLGVRTQIYRANSARLAVVEGIARERPRLLGLFDRNGQAVTATPPSAVTA
jgi:predicted amino acid racemase